MIRALHDELVRWKNDVGRRPFLLRGARQVGKTFAVRHFTQEQFSNCVELNFELHLQLKSIFTTLDPAAIVRTIALTRNMTITPGQTLLFPDEVQECPQAIMALRYFYERRKTVASRHGRNSAIPLAGNVQAPILFISSASRAPRWSVDLHRN